MGCYLSGLKIIIYKYFFFKTIRGVKEWEHGSLLPLTHSFYYYFFIIFIYLFFKTCKPSLEAIIFIVIFVFIIIYFIIFF